LNLKEKQTIYDIYFKYLIFFTLGSLLGCLFETGLEFIKKGEFVSRQGLLYGPFSPVYGVGIVLAVILLEKYYKDNKMIHIFVIGGLLCGIAEFVCSWVQEVFFHTYSWDYSKYPLNIFGRTSVIHIFIWGLMIFLFMQFIYPLIMLFIKHINGMFRKFFIIFLTVFFILDIFISASACIRQYERFKKMEPSNKFEVILDNWYNDNYLKKIYPNKKFKK